MSETTELTFEQGYDRLQQIARRLGEEEVPVSEMCELFAEGKGLERALAAFLEDQRARVEAIERGEGVRAFRITAPSAPSAPPAAPSAPGAPGYGPAADEIPF